MPASATLDGASNLHTLSLRGICFQRAPVRRNGQGRSNSAAPMLGPEASAELHDRLLAELSEAELELRRLQEFRLALIEVEAAKIRAATKAAGDHQDDSDERTTQDTARACMQALPVLAKLERYERRAWSRHRRAIHIYAIAAEE